ncbi:uncharacterized protein N7498_002777 [Penicillium cinerascens]|uniref:DUF7582 domain-containing protein n=1 Tax=Penicillium cinerascens TaxID=70096 RepID=A0A9W9NAM7_9EURO|nr:uncharacterized protein N7498_002777 [Penicillium cinerascens]KAJ5216370.1 hypothetical protein N7498_002777 [Penicillium cinerascens]
MGQSLSSLRRRRSAHTLRGLAARPTQSSPPDLSRETLMNALQNVAAYIASKNQCITLIVVGGTINTILLRSRPNTHDVDFFNDNLTPAEVKCLSKATKSAFKRNRTLGQEWLNNHIVLFIPLHIRRILLMEALDQHAIVFQAPGLTIFAAPWTYLFCTKMHRLSGSGISTVQPYDQDDAVHYLEKYLSQHSTASVTQVIVRSWFAQYLLQWTTETAMLLPAVNSTYKIIFNVQHDPINLNN